MARDDAARDRHTGQTFLDRPSAPRPDGATATTVPGRTGTSTAGTPSTDADAVPAGANSDPADDPSTGPVTAGHSPLDSVESLSVDDPHDSFTADERHDSLTIDATRPGVEDGS